MDESGVSFKNNQGKKSGCSTLIKFGLVILGFYVVLQVMGALNEFFGSSSTLCCSGLIILVIFLYLVMGRGKEQAAEPEEGRTKDTGPHLENGKRLLSQGKRKEAVAAFLQAYRKGSPEVRNQALEALEELGEVETF